MTFYEGLKRVIARLDLYRQEPTEPAKHFLTPEIKNRLLGKPKDSLTDAELWEACNPVHKRRVIDFYLDIQERLRLAENEATPLLPPERFRELYS